MSRRLHDAFLQQGQYLRNWTPATLRTYAQGLRALDHEQPTRMDLDAWVISLRARGLTPGGCNMYIRTVNAYLTWLHEAGHAPERLRVKLLRAPLRQHTLLTPRDLKIITTYRPRICERQTWVLLMTLLDTGIRISEALTLERSRVNFDSLVFVVFGKGRKERTVPFSLGLRRVLFRHLQASAPADFESPYVFTSRTGCRLMARNVFRSVQALGRRLHLSRTIHPHLCRHQYAAHYITQGGDIFRLSRLLGHTAVATTQLYLRSLGVEELCSRTERLTPLTV